MLPADRRRRVVWGANASSLETVSAAAAMMKWSSVFVAFLANREFLEQGAPGQKK